MSEGNRNTISVLIAAYQGERYIREQLESVLHQSRLPDEILIGDDGSTDQTLEICESVGKEFEGDKPEIRILRNPQNLGYDANFYSLMDKASGDVLFLCDQDDVWEPDKIETMMAVFESRPEVLALSAAYSVINENGTYLKKRDGSGVLKTVSLKQFLRYPAYPGMAMAFRKEVLPKVRRMAELISEGKPLAAHDWAVNFAAACENGMFYLDRSLTRYRRHGGNASAMLQFENKGDRFRKRKQLVQELLDNMQAAYGAAEGELPEKWILFEKNRLSVLEKGKLLPLLFFEIRNRKFTALRPALGDLDAVFHAQPEGRKFFHRR